MQKWLRKSCHKTKRTTGGTGVFDFLEQIENDPSFLERVITGDESWIFEYDPETKRQSQEWHTSASPRQKKMKDEQVKNQEYADLFL